MFRIVKTNMLLAIIFILIANTVLLLFALLFFPDRELKDYRNSDLFANEMSAIGMLKTISTAESQFLKSGMKQDIEGIAQYGTIEELASNDPPFISSWTIGNGNGGFKKSGYSFELVVIGGIAPSFQFTAKPIVHRIDGNRSFYMDESAIIRWTDKGDEATHLSPELE